MKMRVCMNDSCPSYDKNYPKNRPTWQGGGKCPRCGTKAPEQNISVGPRNWETGEKPGVIQREA